MLEIVEYADVDRVVWSVLLEEFAEAVVEVVLLCELEDWFACLLAEPYDSLADKLRGPLAWAYKPRCDISCELACRVIFDVE